MGGNPATLKPKGLELAYDATVEFNNEAAIVVDEPNRGLYIRKNASTTGGTLKLAADVTWAGPVAFDAAETVLTKTGAGALILSGDNSTAEGKIAVSEGSLQAEGAYATGRITVTTTDATSASLPAVTPTTAETAARKVAQDWLFVPDGDISKTPAENLARVTSRGWTVPTNYGGLKGWLVTLAQTAVDGGGVMLRVGARKAGFVLVIR